MMPNYKTSGNLRDLLDPISEAPETLSTPAADVEDLPDGPVVEPVVVSVGVPAVTSTQTSPVRTAAPLSKEPQTTASKIQQAANAYAAACDAHEKASANVERLKVALGVAQKRLLMDAEDLELARQTLVAFVTTPGEQSDAK